MDEALTRGWENLVGRVGGPMTFRLIVQPTMALFLATRAGIKDARNGNPPYLWALVSNRRVSAGLMRQAWIDVRRVFFLALIIDSIYQVQVHSSIYLFELLITAAVLAIVPYMVSRGLVNRLARWAGVRPVEGYETALAPYAVIKPAALAADRTGSSIAKSPANHGLTFIARIKPETAESIRAYGRNIEQAIAAAPDALAKLKAHFFRWMLFDLGDATYFMHQGIFDTQFDRYADDAVALFGKLGMDALFNNLEGFPADWKTNVPGFVKFVKDHQHSSFLEYAEYPYVSADEIKKALKLRAALANVPDDAL